MGYKYVSDINHPFPEVVEVLLRSGADPNPITQRMDGPVITEVLKVRNYDFYGDKEDRAQDKRDLEIARLLLEHGADPRAQNSWGHSFLSALAKRLKNYEEIGEEVKQLVRMALEKGASINQKEGRGSPPLYEASYSKGAIFEFYLSFAGASDLNTPVTPDGKTPLHGLALAKNIRGIMQALEKGGDLGVKTRSGETPLLLLFKGGLKLDHKKPLLEQINLFFADLSKLLEQLEGMGAKFNSERDSNGETLLHALSQMPLHTRSYFSELQHLSKYFSNSEFIPEALYKSFPEYTKAVEEKVGELLRFFVQKHAFSINEKDREGWTSFHFLVRTGNPKLIQTAIDLGAEPWIPDPQGQYPGDITVESNEGKLPYWAARLGVFPVKHVDAFAEHIDTGDPEIMERAKIFLSKLLRNDPLANMEMVGLLISRSYKLAQLIKEVLEEEGRVSFGKDIAF